MLAIGRALITNPKLLILDEATEGLAPLIKYQIWSCLDKLKQRGQSILIIDKDITAITKLADRHYILDKGRVVWQGGSPALLAKPETINKYLGVRQSQLNAPGQHEKDYAQAKRCHNCKRKVPAYGELKGTLTI